MHQTRKIDSQAIPIKQVSRSFRAKDVLILSSDLKIRRQLTLLD